MSAHLLEQTKREFVQLFNEQPASIQCQLITTGWHDKTQLARWRRLHVKTMNDLHIRQLKGEAAIRVVTSLPAFLRSSQPELEKVPVLSKHTFTCEYCRKPYVSIRRRRMHIKKFHQAQQ